MDGLNERIDILLGAGLSQKVANALAVIYDLEECLSTAAYLREVERFQTA